MADTVIENPILNRPYDEPRRHFAFDADGITDQVVERRRPSSYFTPVPQSRKGGQQLELTEITADQIRRNDLVDRIRDHVAVWRGAGYPNVTPVSRALLEHWSDPDRDNRVMFCQREAAETAIYLAEGPAPRGGPGTSSFAEALEVALTGDSTRRSRAPSGPATGPTCTCPSRATSGSRSPRRAWARRR
ncbi:MAG: hypothetical protein L0I24_09290 [Pseudonocardia sp.]|nr:hypothetical protein [Actinomycetes bacterium]MDN5931240.1 hypothetical protein [Pseudonocardia sp.]